MLGLLSLLSDELEAFWFNDRVQEMNVDTVSLLVEIQELKQQAQDWKDRYEQRMIAFEDMEADRNWYKSRFDKKTTEDEARIGFEKQHQGRDLSRHHLRGTYTKPAIAALWNQHLKSIGWIESKL